MLKRATDDVELKSFCTIEIKDAEKGEVEAIIATLGVVDKDEDIIRARRDPDGSKVSMSPTATTRCTVRAPVGKGTLHVEGNKLVFKGRVFLATTRGRETFETLKEMGPIRVELRLPHPRRGSAERRGAEAGRAPHPDQARRLRGEPGDRRRRRGTRTVGVKAAERTTRPGDRGEAARRRAAAAEATRQVQAKARSTPRRIAIRCSSAAAVGDAMSEEFWLRATNAVAVWMMRRRSRCSSSRSSSRRW
jgi:hypothetical protein